ncbi:MAG: SspB family protein [Hyphomicrobiales bacterium]
MPEDLMRYDQLAQNALRGVVREALRRVERAGLPGEHHFYIAFHTRHPGVDIGERLAARYPREMTIVLQHQFWNLAVSEDRFQVELSFDNIPEKLLIPFSAVKGFLDPAVQFGLQFEVVNVEEIPQAENKAAAKPAAGEAEVQETEAADEAPKVVSLDAFRKK